MAKERLIIKMAKVSKKAKALASKTKTNKVEEQVKTQDATLAPVEAPKPEEKPQEVVENKETKETPEVKDEKTKKGKKPEVIVPEVVENKKDTAMSISSSIGQIVGSAGGKGDRIDKNHAIEFMGILHKEYLDNPETPEDVKKNLKKQFDVMTAVTLVNYFTQLEGDFQSMGIRINSDMREQAEAVLGDYLGIKVKYIQAEDNSKQLVLGFKEVPEEVRKNAKEDKKVAKLDIPEADPKMSDPEKLKVLRSIFAQQGAGGIGSNLLSGIEWGRRAFSFSMEEKKSVVFANIINKGADATLLAAIKGMVRGKMSSEHSILGAHALLKSWCPSITDKEVAELIQVIVSINAEKKTNDWNEKASPDLKTTYEKELEAVTRNIITANTSKAIDAILKGKEEATLEYEDRKGFITIHPKAIRRTLEAAYGDSENILKDKMEEIAKYYVKPIMRLSSYVDKSAYSEE